MRDLLELALQSIDLAFLAVWEYLAMLPDPIKAVLLIVGAYLLIRGAIVLEPEDSVASASFVGLSCILALIALSLFLPGKLSMCIITLYGACSIAMFIYVFCPRLRGRLLHCAHRCASINFRRRI